MRFSLHNNTSDKEEMKVNLINNNEVKITAYPNPFNDELNIGYRLANDENQAVIMLMEVGSGKIYAQYPVTENHGVLNFNTKNLSVGIYLISITQKNLPAKYIKLVNIK